MILLNKLWDAAFKAGRREALREAARLAEERADITAELAPKGRLGLGLQRASIAHDLAIELRAMAKGGR